MINSDLFLSIRRSYKKNVTSEFMLKVNNVKRNPKLSIKWLSTKIDCKTTYRIVTEKSTRINIFLDQTWIFPAFKY